MSRKDSIGQYGTGAEKQQNAGKRFVLLIDRLKEILKATEECIDRESEFTLSLDQDQELEEILEACKKYSETNGHYEKENFTYLVHQIVAILKSRRPCFDMISYWKTLHDQEFRAIVKTLEDYFANEVNNRPAVQ